MRQIVLALAFFGATLPAQAYDGCLGASVTACLDAARPFLRDLDYAMARRNIDKYLAGDIAGRRKPKGQVSVAYHSKFAEAYDPPQLLTLAIRRPWRRSRST